MPVGVSYQDSNFKKVISLEHPDIRRSLIMIGGVGKSTTEAGTVFGKITSGEDAGKVRPLGLTYITQAEAEAASTFKVADASVLKVGDSIKIADGSAVTITAVDKVNNTFSVDTEDAQTADLNDAVTLQDGSDTAFGVSVEPLEASDTDQPVPLIIHGVVYEKAITNALLATQLTAVKEDLFNRLWFIESY